MELHDLWALAINWLTLLLKEPQFSPPASSNTDDKMLRSEEVYSLSDKIDSFEAAVDSIKQIQWETRKEISLASDYNTLYGYLRLVERLDPMCRQSRSQFQSLIKYYDLPDPITALMRQLELAFSALEQSMGAFQSHVRHRINVLSRPACRPLNVLGLPSELLMEIFYYMRDPDYWPEEKLDLIERVKGIQHARLACRRFHDACSDLLVPNVCVEVHSDSLSRLQQISRHPIVSKGVRSLTVRLTYYHSALAENMGLFVYFQPRSNTQHGKSASRILWAWKQVTENPELDPLMDLYRVGHALYQNRYKDQKQLLETGQFVKAVISALAQFPCATKLVFDDWIPDAHEAYGRTVAWEQFSNDPLELRKFSVRPHSPLTIHNFWLEPEMSLDPAVEILAGMATTRTAVKDVSFYNMMFNPSLPISQPDILKNIRITAKQLHAVYIGCGAGRAYVSDGVEAEFYQFVSALLETDSLRRIWVEPPQLTSSDLSISPYLVCREWPKLEELYLSGISTHGGELVRLVDSLPLRETRPDKSPWVYLHRVELLSGSWLNVWQSLQTKASVGSEISTPLGRMDTNPSNWRRRIVRVR
ncbi:hypothetical protein F5B18DRAFT_670492 [Nemania serpens]|nr:hypothetical protein F5B18DRAFT_670492 [Nemania serpens]